MLMLWGVGLTRIMSHIAAAALVNLLQVVRQNAANMAENNHRLIKQLIL